MRVAESAHGMPENLQERTVMGVVEYEKQLLGYPNPLKLCIE
jgi:hypothetical protein